VFDLVGLCVFTVEDLKVEAFWGGLFGGSDTNPVIIFSDNMDVSSGNTVTVEGFAFGWSDVAIIIGDSGIEVLGKMVLGTAPTSAKVEICPHIGCYLGIVLVITGFMLTIASVASKKKQDASYGSQYPYHYQQYQTNYQQPYPTQAPIARPVEPKNDARVDESEKHAQSPEAKPVVDADQQPPPEVDKDDNEWIDAPTHRDESLSASRPSPTQQQSYSEPRYPCRYCGQTLHFVNEYQRWYCDSCRQYN
jgi:hypothetical protein